MNMTMRKVNALLLFVMFADALLCLCKTFRRRFEFPDPITLKLDHCSIPNPYWNKDYREVVLCFELIGIFSRFARSQSDDCCSGRSACREREDAATAVRICCCGFCSRTGRGNHSRRGVSCKCTSRCGKGMVMPSSSKRSLTALVMAQ